MNAKSKKTRVLIIDDHPLLRQGIAVLINAEKDMEVCGQVDDALVAISKIEKLAPDIIVLDITLKSHNGIELLKNIKARFPQMQVLILSMHDENIYAPRALRAGAAGYVMKHEATENVITALRKILSGEIYMSQEVSSRLLNRMVGGRSSGLMSPVDELSDRELEVFTLLGKGLGTRPIAEKLHLSVKTIESHRAKIKEKLNLKTANELVHHAIQWVQNESITVQA
jgi:DNA-binding NarL/FixJ family response regulator